MATSVNRNLSKSSAMPRKSLLISCSFRENYIYPYHKHQMCSIFNNFVHFLWTCFIVCTCTAIQSPHVCILICIPLRETTPFEQKSAGKHSIHIAFPIHMPYYKYIDIIKQWIHLSVLWQHNINSDTCILLTKHIHVSVLCSILNQSASVTVLFWCIFKFKYTEQPVLKYILAFTGN